MNSSEERCSEGSALSSCAGNKVCSLAPLILLPWHDAQKKRLIRAAEAQEGNNNALTSCTATELSSKMFSAGLALAGGPPNPQMVQGKHQGLITTSALVRTRCRFLMLQRGSGRDHPPLGTAAGMPLLWGTFPLLDIQRILSPQPAGKSFVQQQETKPCPAPSPLH